MKISYLASENAIQKIYSDLGLIVPVGDLSVTKAPAIQPLPTSSTQTTVTAQFNVISGGDITALSYKVNDGDAVSLTPAKGVITITLEDLEYNSGPYEIEITATNETGSTATSSTIDLQHYTNWATPDEVLDGNKYIGEDGEEHVGELVPDEIPEGLSYLGIPVFEYSVSEDPDTGENVIDYARLVEGSTAHASDWAAAGLGPIDSYQIFYKWTCNDGEGTISGDLAQWQIFESIDHPGATYVDLSSDLDADALANEDYYLEAFEIIVYNGVEYATECMTYPLDKAEGGPVIESGTLDIYSNGYADVTGYDSIEVDVQPSDGGAVLSSIECGEDPMMMGMPYVVVSFDTLPSPMDFNNHTYFIQVVAETVTAITDPVSGTSTPTLKYDQILALDMGMPSSQNAGPNYAWYMDANTFIYGLTASWLPTDTDDSLLPTTNAKVYIYEDDITNVKFIISGTLVNIDLNN